MGTQNITEKTVGSLSPDAYVLVTQNEIINGDTVRVLRRIPIKNFAAGLGADVQFDEEAQRLYLLNPSGVRIGTGTPITAGITGLQMTTDTDDDGMQYLLLLDDKGNEICRTEFAISGGGGGVGRDVITLSNKTYVDGERSTAISTIRGLDVAVSYEFYIKDAMGNSVEGGATAKYYVNNALVRYEPISQGLNTVTFSADDLPIGTNAVVVRVEDADGNKRSLTYTVSVIDLTISSTFSNSSAFVASEMGSNVIEFPYIPYGGSNLTKVVHFEIDGTETATETTKNSGKTMTYTLPVLSHGAHTLRCWSTAVVNGQNITSNVLSYNIAFISETGTDIIISSDYAVTTVAHGEPINIPYLVYDPRSLTTHTKIQVQQRLINEDTGNPYWSVYSESDVNVVDRSMQLASIRDYPVGQLRIVIQARQSTVSAYNYSRGFELTVTGSAIDISPLTASLALDMNTFGRSNSENTETRGIWQSNTDASVTATLEDFNWVTNGWINDSSDRAALKISGDARLTIPYTPFARNAIGTNGAGITIDLDFMVDDVYDTSAVLMSCMTGDGPGFKITADKVIFASDLQSVETQFEAGKRVRITLVADNPQGSDKLLRMYTNGVGGSGSGMKAYSSDSMQQGTPAYITAGAAGATLYLYAVRVYNIAHTPRDVVANEIAHYNELADKITAHDRNDIYTTGSDNVSMSAIQAADPDLTVVYLSGAALPSAQVDISGSVSKVGTKLSGRIIDPDNELCAEFENQDWDVQGTSSAAYFRKNIRAKFKNLTQNGVSVKGYRLKTGYIPAGKICFKKDVASSEQGNNTVMANYYNTICPYKTPPQLSDRMVRQGIDGKPCVIFFSCTDPGSPDYNNGQPQFVGKYNMNLDKGNDEVFGFGIKDENDNEIYPRAQSWEFRNNTSDRCQFRSADFVSRNANGSLSWLTDFEARYAPGGDEEDSTELAALFAWIASTNTENATGTALPAPYYATNLMANAVVYDTYIDTNDNNAVKYRTVTDSSGHTRRVVLSSRFDTETVTVSGTDYTVMPIDSGGNEVYKHTTDTATYREDKFYQEFEDHFIKSDVLFYYLFTEYYLMIDNRAKNMFITTYDGVHWLFLPYDFDTMMGINNEGELAFSYGTELTDTQGTSFVCNDQGRSVLWNNVRNTMSSELAAEFSALESQGLFSPRIVNSLFESHQGAWPMNLWNEDQDWAYGVPHRNGDNTYLPMWQGDKALHRLWWLTHRHTYMCSRYLSASAVSDRIMLRLYRPQSGETLNHVAPGAAFTLTSWQDVYLNVRWGSYYASQRARAGTAVTLQPPAGAGSLNDTETYIYSVSALKDIGDLSPMYLGQCDVSCASHLERLIVGNSNSNYENTNLKALTVGNNNCLKKVDVRGCTALTGILDLSGCENIREVYAERTALTYIKLPKGGYLERLHVPAVQKLTITNQENLTDFFCSDYTGITALRIENVPGINLSNILNACTNLGFLRLTDVDWTESDGTRLERLLTMHGIDENDNTTTGSAVITGTLHVESIDGDLLSQLRNAFPYLTITYGSAGVSLRFVNGVNDDGEGGELLFTELLTYGATGHYPYDNSHSDIVMPTLGSTAEYDYTFNGWSGSIANVTASRTITALYTKTRRSYGVTWKNGNTVLGYGANGSDISDGQNVVYGTYAEWSGSDPSYTGSETDMVFAGWNFTNTDDDTVINDALRSVIHGTTVAQASFIKLAVPSSPTPFASCTWGQIIALCRAAYDGTLQTKTGYSSLHNYGWEVGDETTIELKSGEEVVLKIWGFDINKDTNGNSLPVTIGTKYSLRDTRRANNIYKYLFGYTVTGGGSTATISPVSISSPTVLPATTTYQNTNGATNIEINITGRTYLDSIKVIDGANTWTYYLNGARNLENTDNRLDVNYLAQEDSPEFTARDGKVEINTAVQFSYQNSGGTTSPVIIVDGTNGKIKIYDRNISNRTSNDYRALEFLSGSKITIPMTANGSVEITGRSINNSGGYYASELREWLTETFIDELPAIIQSCAAGVKRKTQVGGLDWDDYDTYTDKLFIPTYRELGFGTDTSQPYCNESDTPFPTFSSNEMRRLSTYRSGNQNLVSHVWLSSAGSTDVGSFVVISSDTGSNSGYYAYNSNAVIFGFCPV